MQCQLTGPSTMKTSPLVISELLLRTEPPKKMSGELDNNSEDYRSLTYEDWCDLLYTIKVKDERKGEAVHTKKIDSAREASLSDSKEPMRITRRKKKNTGVLRSKKSPIRAHDRPHGAQRYCVICKKSGISERKYASHSADNCTGVRTKRSIKDGMGGPIGSRNNAVQQHTKSEKNPKEELKALKKQNKMLYSIAKKSGSRLEIKKIKNIRADDYKKTSVSSSKDWDSNSLLVRNSSRDKNRRPAGRKEINKLDHVVIDNLKNYKGQSNEAIISDPTLN